ncbi:uncharacterized protein LOC108033498 [Drosophila biarmipes]|uniref:uncharacterized protein LOC108033498 n=1 Tax=Drosophila biarmipes TaxID=125945 RepID=UPI0007E6B315|nr:uncharacterized protein LOC108033498 [Drosophila biarmipes]
MFDTTKYFPRSVDSEHPSQSESTELAPLDNPVKYDMVHNLEGNSVYSSKEDTEGIQAAAEAPSSTPQLMIIFEDGDINSALHFLIESVHNPFAPNAVAMVLVEERMREDIINRILPRLHPLSEFVAEHPNYLASLEKCESYNHTEVAPPLASPIFVCECNHDVLGNYPTGVITFYTFRNNREAIDICQRETLNFASVSIWNETLEGSYDLVVALNSSNFFLNCSNVNLSPISKHFEAERNHVVIENAFHYETICIYEKFKIIVFPIGELILAGTEDSKEEQSPISFLES